MRKKHSRVAATLATVALVGGAVAMSSPAYALGSAAEYCGSQKLATGYSASTTASTAQSWDYACGSVKVRIGYWAPGGVSAYSGWSYGSKLVAISSSSYGSIFAGNHGVTSSESGYPYADYFTT